MHDPRARFLAALAFSCALAGAPMPAAAQPEPSFRSSCGDLRAALQALDVKDEALVTVQVVGPLTSVQSDGALAYLSLCAPPDPRVLCVTYDTNGRRAGDVVVVSGTYYQRGPDHVQLDPCLHFQPGQGTRPGR